MSPRFFLLSSIFLCFNNSIVPADGDSPTQEEREASEALFMLEKTATPADGASPNRKKRRAPRANIGKLAYLKYSELYKYFAKRIEHVAECKPKIGTRGGSVPTTLKIIKDNPNNPLPAILAYCIEHGNQIKNTSAFMQAKRHGAIINNHLDPKMRVSMNTFARARTIDEVNALLFHRRSPKKTATKQSATRA